MGENTNLFVYGSLKPGAWNHRLIESQVHSACPASTRGILCALGGIPAMIPGNGIVRGILLEVNTAALTITDRLEGVPHFYRRKETTVMLDDGREVKAWTYEYAEPTRISHCPRLLLDHIDSIPVYSWQP